MNHIVRRLNEAGIPTPSHTKKATGIISHKNLIGKNAWQTRTVSRILSCETYTGNLVQGKTKTVCHRQTYADESNWIKVENTHEAIINCDMFDAVQTFRRQVAEEAIQTPKSPYTPNMFKGEIYCGHCGGSLHRQRCEAEAQRGCLPVPLPVQQPHCKRHLLPVFPPGGRTAASLDHHPETRRRCNRKGYMAEKNKPAMEAGRTAAKSSLLPCGRSLTGTGGL